MGTQGEKSLDIDLISRNKADMFPDENTPNLLFDGVRFAELPVCHIKATKNNTHVHVVTVKGEELAFKTCGREGFKNARKGTNIAAQATALSVSSILKEKGVKNLRVKIQGIGPGRMSSVKGLQMGGMTIISLTDSTPISFNPPRPRKARRL
jgi:small subunit ribosomal protein S11